MRNLSSRNGRAFEYIVVSEIRRSLSAHQIQITARALQAQQKDQQKYLDLPTASQRKYQKAAERIFDWLEREFSISSRVLSIDRLSDDDARRGDVTDIRITTSSRQINLSIKHNHKALKHQRPASTTQHCGYPAKSSEDLQFRENYKAIIETFKGVSRNIHYFRELDEGVILNYLYVPICDLVAQSINELCLQAVHSNHLFTFLVGKTDFYKIIFNEQQNELRIQSFSKPSFVNSVIAQSVQSYVYLNFSNSWKVSMRLHTASSRIANNPSLKFDTQLNSDALIPEQRISV